MDFAVAALRDACRALIEQAAVVKDAVLAHRADMWCAVPTFDPIADPQALEASEPSAEAWYRLADELTNIWMGDHSGAQHHGVLACPVSTVLDELALLNQTKAQVAEASRELKRALFERQVRRSDARIDAEALDLLDVARSEFLAKGRDQSFHRILRSLQLPSLNFMRAQKQVRVLAPVVARISYTWNKVQYRKRAIDVGVLHALAQHHQRMGHEPRAEAILEGLARHRLQPGMKLYRLVHGTPTLRANYKHQPTEGAPWQWSHCLATGILVVAQAERPQIRWKPAPTKVQIQQAQTHWLSTASLEPVTISPGLELYRNES